MIMERQTDIAQTIELAADRARYDECAKKLLTYKAVIAWILKSCTKEFSQYSVKFICDNCLNENVELSEHAVHQDQLNRDERLNGDKRLDGLNTEANAVKDQTVYYDIRFKATLPESKEPVQLIINLEIQLNDTPGYPLVTRGFYYCARMISEQYGTVFTDEHYEKIQKVYSIWICPDPAKKRKNGIFRYHTVEDSVRGNSFVKSEAYDLMEVVILNLGDADESSDLEILDDRYFEHLGIPAGENNTLTMEEYVNMIHPDDRQPMADAFVVQLSGNTTFDKTVPFRLRRGDGTWEWFEGQSTYIANISGHPYRLVGICLSIQEYKDIENTLIEARKKAEESDRLKMAFLANMSHEIRTPLNAIVGFSDVIGSTYDELSEEERADFVRLISINSEHLVRLIDDILDLSKIESNTIKFTFSNCSLNSLMMDIEKEQAMKPISEIEIKSLLPDEDVYINTDITRLKEVICNFINNARKFTQKGYIHFGYTLDNRNADSVQIFVENTGSGIPQECLNEIFDRFYKVDTFKQGTGLGLSICKTIVEHLQGDISVKSEIGKGSCFTVTLPFDRKTED